MIESALMPTLRRSRRRSLDETPRIFREIAENIRDVVWVTDTSKERMLYISPSYEAIWGRTRESLYRHPKSWLEAIHPQDRASVQRAALTCQVKGAYDVEYRVLRPDGSVRWIHDRAFPILVDGQVRRVVGLAEDVTERKQAEEDRRARERALAERDLLAKVSHELRTPLTAIKGFAETLRHAQKRSDRLQFIETIERHADRLSRLVDNLMVAALLEAGSRHHEPAPIPLPAFVADVLAQLEPVAARRGQSLSASVPDLRVLADPGDLHHILSNLIDNAAKFSEPGGRILVSARADGETVELSVRDHGPGIAAEDLPLIFERFHRGARAGGVGGAGLGLSIVRELVEAQGGRVWAENAPDRGACVRFTLPSANRL